MTESMRHLHQLQIGGVLLSYIISLAHLFLQLFSCLLVELCIFHDLFWVHQHAHRFPLAINVVRGKFDHIDHHDVSR